MGVPFNVPRLAGGEAEGTGRTMDVFIPFGEDEGLASGADFNGAQMAGRAKLPALLASGLLVVPGPILVIVIAVVDGLEHPRGLWIWDEAASRIALTHDGCDLDIGLGRGRSKVLPKKTLVAAAAGREAVPNAGQRGATRVFMTC